MIIIEEFRGGDGAHCGIADWYPAKRDALRRALKSGQPFDTGWYSSKKEIASARISSWEGDAIQVEVSVSDDFDTPGHGSSTCRPTLRSIERALYRAWDEANEAQKDNRQYRGYSVVHWSVEIPKWLRGPGCYPRERRKRYHKKQLQCVDYFIAPVDNDRFLNAAGDHFDDGPPGDNYHHWGWQRSDDGGKTPEVDLKIPEAVALKLAEFATGGQDGFLRLGDWEIKSWDNE